MAEHPIQGLMTTAMENIKQMVDVNTIIGDPVETPEGSVIIPVSRVGFGFAAGGSEFKGGGGGSSKEEDGGDGGGSSEKGGSSSEQLPFGGGSGGGMSISPVAFLVVNNKGVRILNMDSSTHLYDRLLDAAPGLMDRLQGMVKSSKKDDKCQEPKNDI
ncbi:GerW family sporulation protein [Mechercharimyces sp. CAU 1602]|uniref:GerW family sporulation protein n=1 Tax=Mechercharimyces sp. CAU 1602 TaxID=2973933 RepID=UPI002161AD26|nr:GerW family sporulation protein [Mechercharimyces sp. CAU 1602]MCS1350865.1 GerW family sporulation protein [Mechercharimyces sp. CAU 1602]